MLCLFLWREREREREREAAPGRGRELTYAGKEHGDSKGLGLGPKRKTM